MRAFADRALAAGITLVAPATFLLGGHDLPAVAAPTAPYATSTAVALHIKDIGPALSG
ncbi:MAG TPA: hypothetical protein VGG16_25905 [Streptosporangiaceae bacterium]|jgi:hypothetical protein